MKQVFLDIECKVDSSVSLDQNQAHHIFDVLRTTKNEKIRVVDCNQNVYLAHVETKPNLYIMEELESFKPIIKTTLCCALIKQDKFEWMLQKACELQVTHIIPFTSKNTIVKIDDKKIEKKMNRWNEILVSACKQSNQVHIPKIQSIVNINDLEKYKSELNLVAYEKESDPSRHLAHYLNKLNKSVTMCIGPEGGFEENEIAYLNEIGYSNCSLGQSILRAETAACYVLSAIEYQAHIEREEK